MGLAHPRLHRSRRANDIRPMSRIFLSLALTAAVALAAEPPEVPAGFVIETVCEGLDAAVTMDVARDGRVFSPSSLGRCG